ncbi:PAAR domain-containing protein [Caballeronia sp. RCC_10]|uniref:PAAR domain-containing protein n=1 Tax=Caballeronia TaxID=1827195 RepID=UPI00352492E2
MRSIDIVRLDDCTDHGGKVITASETMNFRGRKVARKGDKVSCPLHPEVDPNVIIDGDEKIRDRGVPVARHGHRATCGCSLISSVE